MNDRFSKEVIYILENAEDEMLKLRHPYVGSEHLLLSLLKMDKNVKKILKEFDVNYSCFKKELVKVVGSSSKESEYILYTPLLRKILNDSLDIDDKVDGMCLFKSILKQKDGIAISILKNIGINLKKLIKSLDNTCSKLINGVGYLMNSVVDKVIVIDRDREVLELIDVLMKKDKCNPILVGHPGVGKTVIVEEFVRRINNGMVPNKLLDTNVYSISLGNLVSGTKYRGDFESRLKSIIDECLKTKSIIFIDEIHGLSSCGNAEGAVSAAEILKPYIAKGELKVIGATTEREYNAYISKDKALVRRFDLIKINEPSDSSTLNILKGIKKDYELFHEVLISNDILKSIIDISGKYFKSKCNPDRSIELLDLVCAKKKFKVSEDMNTYKINRDDIYSVIKDKYNLDIELNVVDEFKNKMNNIIGQDIVKCKLLKLIEYKYKNEGEVVSALLIGKTGVGKSEMIKLLGSCLGDNCLIKLDMSEYNLDSSISKLIGTTSGYVGYNDYYEFEKVKLNPFSIILVDEVEKASNKVLNLFLNILDEGIVKDGSGDVIDFRNCMIFFTSNLGSSNGMGFTRRKINDLEEYFTPELLGRFDEILEFDDISEDNVREFVKGLNTKVKIKDILNKCDYKRYGLRNVKKVIKSLEFHA